MNFKPQSGCEKTVFEEAVQLSPILQLEVCLIHKESWCLSFDMVCVAW